MKEEIEGVPEPSASSTSMVLPEIVAPADGEVKPMSAMAVENRKSSAFKCVRVTDSILTVGVKSWRPG